MQFWRHHMDVWWEALRAPERAGSVVLEGVVVRGFLPFLFLMVATLYALYGFSMGLFAGVVPALVSMVKLPLLYLASIAVAAPSLYALNAMVGLRMSLGQCARLLLLCLSVNALALASYAPVSFFFVLTSFESTYQFLVVMHVLVFAASGLASLGMILLLSRAAARARNGRHHPGMVAAWGIIYGLVGSQMSWAMRPWIGSPSEPYALMRPMESSFVEAVWELVQQSLG